MSDTLPDINDLLPFDGRAVLQSASTQNGYTDALTLWCPTGRKLTFFPISGAQIVYQLGLALAGTLTSVKWGQEATLAPGYYSLLRRFDAVRIRSAVAGAPAVVNLEALRETDL